MTPPPRPVSTPDDIIWEEPRARAGRGRGRAIEINAMVQTLKGNPGRWALVASGTHSDAAGNSWRRRGCQTRSVVVETLNADGQRVFDIYARWPKDDDPERQ